MIGITPRRS